MMGRHQLDGLAYRVRGRNPEELVALLTQQMTDGLHETPNLLARNDSRPRQIRPR